MAKKIILNYKPKQQAVFIKIYTDHGGAYFAEVNDKPMSKETLAEITKYFREIENATKTKKAEINFDGIIPEGLLYFDFKTFMNITWERKAQSSLLIFNSKDIKGRFEVMLPKMYFKVVKNNYTIRFVDKKGLLYHAPFFNNGDKMCMGNEKILNPSNFKSISQYIQALEDRFFFSAFTHRGNSKPNLKINVETYWKQITSGKRKITFRDLIKV